MREREREKVARPSLPATSLQTFTWESQRAVKPSRTHSNPVSPNQNPVKPSPTHSHPYKPTETHSNLVKTHSNPVKPIQIQSNPF